MLKPLSHTGQATLFYFLPNCLSPALNSEPLRDNGLCLIASVSPVFSTDFGTKKELVNIHRRGGRRLKHRGSRSCHPHAWLGLIKEKNWSFPASDLGDIKNGAPLVGSTLPRGLRWMGIQMIMVESRRSSR